MAGLGGGLSGNEPELFSLEDEDGVRQDFELVDRLESGGELYYALVPYYESSEEELESDGELVVLKSDYDENNEELLVSIDDDDEYERIGNIFLDRLNKLSEEEEEENDGDIEEE
jgi:uncharacterized protein YrzB (UPF0473 family)